MLSKHFLAEVYRCLISLKAVSEIAGVNCAARSGRFSNCTDHRRSRTLDRVQNLYLVPVRHVRLGDTEAPQSLVSGSAVCWESYIRSCLFEWLEAIRNQYCALVGFDNDWMGSSRCGCNRPYDCRVGDGGVCEHRSRSCVRYRRPFGLDGSGSVRSSAIVLDSLAHTRPSRAPR